MELRLASDSDPPASVFGTPNDKILEWVLNPEDGRNARGACVLLQSAGGNELCGVLYSAMCPHGTSASSVV